MQQATSYTININNKTQYTTTYDGKKEVITNPRWHDSTSQIGTETKSRGNLHHASAPSARSCYSIQPLPRSGELYRTTTPLPSTSTQNPMSKWPPRYEYGSIRTSPSRPHDHRPKTERGGFAQAVGVSKRHHRVCWHSKASWPWWVDIPAILLVPFLTNNVYCCCLRSEVDLLITRRWPKVDDKARAKYSSRWHIGGTYTPRGLLWAVLVDSSTHTLLSTMSRMTWVVAKR